MYLVSKTSPRLAPPNRHTLSSLEDLQTHSATHVLVMTGGHDIDPLLYGEQPDRQTYHIRYDPLIHGDQMTRDIWEVYALLIAMRTGIPVFGICRGLQLMAVVTGAKLTQDIEPELQYVYRHDIAYTTDGAALLGLPGVLGDVEIVTNVNSMHHQGVEINPAEHLVLANHTIDAVSVVEIIKWRNRPWFGCQFHPESMGESGDFFYRWFVEMLSQGA